MLILIVGGSSCGKSAFAEKLAVEIRDKSENEKKCQAPLIYIATMEPFSEEAKERIEHHHELRAGKGFSTLEQYVDVEKVIPQVKKMSGQRKVCGEQKPIVLLECLSNLLANEMFAPGVTEDARKEPDFEQAMCRKISAGILELEKATDCLIVVSCIVSEDGADYAWETVKYIHILEQIQAALAGKAQRVYEVVCGIPVVIREGIL